ncbi:hypothetical protein, partial [Streptomyces sp. NPDC060022]|uniref:hypothetical protein n=1 Tax=Streptomyces sp. NPDC060022 TaxID=3347039 RepID=UPI0036BFFFFF
MDASEMPGGGQWNAGPTEATSVAPATVRPRFPDFYSDEGWEGESWRFERALGRALNTSGKSDLLQGGAVWALFEVLKKAYPERDVLSAFFGPGTVDAAAAWARLMSPAASRSELMDAFVNAAYANGSAGITLSRLWAEQPELNTRHLPLRPPAAVPYDVSDPVFLDRRDRRGLLMTSAPATEAEWLFGVYQSLKIPAHLNEPLNFRDALLAWALPTGRQSLFEILEASERADVEDPMLPDLAEADAARLHAWADALRRATHMALEGGPLTAELVPPHRIRYARATGWLTGEVTGTPGALRSIWTVTGVPSAHQYPMFQETPGDGTAHDASRRAAVQDWLEQHRDGDLLTNVWAEHLPALYLASGADGALLRAVSEDGAAGVARLGAAARAVVQQALSARAPDGVLPLLLLRERPFRDKFDEIKAAGAGKSVGWTPDQWNLVRLAGDWVGGMSEEVKEHREMALEAVGLLPPTPGVVWWASREPDVPLMGALVSVPALHGVALSESAAVRGVAGAPVGGDTGRLVVWEVADSTARDVSPFARDPRAGLGLYPDEASLRVVGVSYRRGDEEARTPYVHVTLKEVAKELPASAWDRGIVTRPLIQPSSGQQLGVTSELESVARARVRFFLDTRSYRVMHVEETMMTDPRPLPWVGGAEVFVWSSHSDGRGFWVASRYGHKKASPAEVGRYLEQVLAALRPGRKVDLVLYSCSSGRKLPGLSPVGLGVASWSGYRTTAPERAVGSRPTEGIDPVEEESQNPFVYYLQGDRSGFRPGWRSFDPLARVTGAVPAGGVSGVNRERRVPRFRALEGTERWEEVTRRYDSELGRAMAADPQLIVTARDAVELLFVDLAKWHGRKGAWLKLLPSANPGVAKPESAMRRLLDPRSNATLDELMQAFERGVAVSGEVSLPRLLARYSGLVVGSASDVSQGALRDLRKVLLGWLLPGNKESLAAIVEASHGVGLKDAGETAVLVGEAADLYVWADAEFAPGASVDGLLPHRVVYLDHADWFTGAVSGDGAVPRGLWSAVGAGVRSLDEDGTVARLPETDGLSLPRVSWGARQEALRAWRGRHGGSPLAVLHPAHGVALYLLGGADRVFLDARFVEFERSRGVRELLGREVRSVVVRAVEGGGRFPFLLMRDAE